MGQARPPRDAGLQAERTALAWNRTGLAVLVNGLLALRTGWSSAETPITALAVVLLLAAGAAVFYGNRRRRHLLSGDVPTAPAASVIVTTVLIGLLACATGLASLSLL